MRRAAFSRPGDMAEYQRDFDAAINEFEPRASKPGYAESYTDLAVRFVLAVVFFIIVFTPPIFGIRFGLQFVGLIQ